MGVDKLDAMIESLYGKQVHILVDSDNEGEKSVNGLNVI